MGRLDGRVALVVGASRGFGRAIALAFGQEGADVVVNYHASAPVAAEVVAALEKRGRRALAVKADVADQREVRALVDATLKRFDRLDVLVNNAGIMDRGLCGGRHRRLRADVRDQRHGHHALHARRAAGHDRAQVRPHHQPVFAARACRCRHRGLRRLRRAQRCGATVVKLALA